MLFKIGVACIFVFASLLHSLYDFTQVEFLKIISPINESVWEHMKMMFYSIFIWSVIDYFIRKNSGMLPVGYCLSRALGLMVGTFLVAALHYSYQALFGHTPLTFHLLIVLFIAILVQVYTISIPTLCANSNACRYLDYIGAFVIILMIAMFTYFTYNPGSTEIFSDFS